MKGFKKEKTIGIIGYGFIGSAIEHLFSPTAHVMINDIAREIDNMVFFSKKDLVDKCDIIFMAVPTPYSLSNGYVPDIVDKVLKELDLAAVELNKRPIVIIKSAVLPSHVRKIQKQFENVEVLISPEYLSAKNPIGDMFFSNIWILGGKKEACELALDIIMKHSLLNSSWANPKVGICSAVDAALIKYMENCFLAMKCNFASEFFLMHEEIKTDDSVDFNEMLRLWQFDPRCGSINNLYPSKIPYDGEISFDSGCVSKDTRAIRDEANSLNSPFILNKANLECQMEYRKEMKDPLWRGMKNGSELIE